ncbi:MAG: MFS transporter [Chloroflexi bacterium]|nr:MFS transporter [Chloroflexota bacterium]
MNQSLKSNIFHLYMDVFWFGIFVGSTMTFISVYLTRLGANSFQIGLLTAAPAIVNLIISLPVGRWLEGRSYVHTTFQLAVWHRSSYLLTVLLPLFISSYTIQIWAMVGTVSLISVVGGSITVAFNSMFAEVVPGEMRAHVVGRRNALVALSSITTSFLCGRILDSFPFPSSYVIVFGFGFIGMALSGMHLGQIRKMDSGTPPAAAPESIQLPLVSTARAGDARLSGLRLPTRTGGSTLIRFDLLLGSFRNFLIAFFLFYTFQYAPVPLFPLTFVRVLHLTDGEISLGTGVVFYTAFLIFSMGLSRLTKRFGGHRVLVVSAVLYCLYPIFISVWGTTWSFWLASFVGGGSWGVLAGALINRLMERVPDVDRPAHMALHNIALNLGILFGSMIGPVLGAWFDLRTAMFISGVLRFLAAMMLGVWG